MSRVFYYVSFHEFPSKRAYSIQIVDFLNALQKRCEVHFITYTHDIEAVRGQLPIRIDVIRLRGPGKISKLASLLHAMAKNRIRGKTVYTRSPIALVASVLLFRNLTLLEMHEELPGWFVAVLRMLPKERFKLVSISKYLTKKCHEKGLNNTCWLPLSSPGWSLDPGRDQTHKEFECGYAGSVWRGKGVEVLLAASKLLPRCRFLLIGDVQGIDIEEYPNVTFRGFVPHAQVGYELNRCRMLLAPYESSVFGAQNRTEITNTISPLKIIDYISLNIPVIASSIQNVRDLFSDEHLVFCEPGDPDMLAATISEVLAFPERYGTKASLAYKLWQQRHTTESRVDTILELTASD